MGHLRLFKTIRTMEIDENTLLEVFGEAFIKCHEIAARRSGKARWADKNPENVLYLDQWYTLLGGNFTFINVIRNPLDALASLVEAGFKKTIPKKFAQKAALYNEYLDKAYSFITKHPDDSHTLRYEDLVTNPQETLSALLSYLDEPYDEAMLKDFFSHHRKSGIEDPKIAQTRSIHSHSIDRWKKDLSRRQIKICSEHLSHWISKLKYDL